MKIMIAGTYVKLTFGMRHYLINSFDKIIIYPKQYYSKINKEWHKGEFNPGMRAVVFSWEDFLYGFEYKNDNINLGLHVFTHALHVYCFKTNETSASIFYDEFERIKRYVSNDEVKERLKSSDYFRSYAFTNPYEFVAVLLEHFFETPQEFKNEFPDLFQKVRKMINYRVN